MSNSLSILSSTIVKQSQKSLISKLNNNNITYRTSFPSSSFSSSIHTSSTSFQIKNNNNNFTNNISYINNNNNNKSIFKLFNNNGINNNNNNRFYSVHTTPTNTPIEKKTTILDIKKKFESNIPITMVTAYDYCSAKEVDNAGIDMLLVGDSLGMVVLGEKGTSNVTMEQMIHHCKAAMKGVKRTFVVGDLPFGSFETSTRDAVANAFRLMKEGGVDAVKLEGGKKHAATIAAIVNAGMPVIGHIGLTPQSVSALGGFRLQGKTSEQAMSILEDALALQEAGCSAIVIEMVPEIVATQITKQLSIPTIGIGAGNGTSGQVLVYHDMLGLYSDFLPKFCKQYATLSKTIQDGLKEYKRETEQRQFPTQAHSFTMKQEESQMFIEKLNILNNHNQEESSTASNNKQNIDSLFSHFSNPNNINQSVKELMEREKAMETLTFVKDKKSNNNNNNKSTPLLTSIEQAKLNIVPDKKNKKKIAVIGAGAMGSFFSAKIASKEIADVWMVSAWKEHVEKINRDGLTFYNLKGEKEKIKSIRATLDAKEIIKDGYPDIVFVLVKSPATKQASLTASTIVAGNPNAIILTLQNGVGNREEIEQTITEKGYKNRVWQGVTSNGCYVVEPGIVRHTGSGPTYLAASPSIVSKSDYGMENRQDSKEEREALESLKDILINVGIESQVSNDIDALIWGKVVANAAINPLSAVLGVQNGYLINNEYPKSLMKKIVGEGMEVCRAKGIKLPYGDDTEQGFKYVTDIAQRTSSNYSSMLVDVIRGQPTEIKSINGVIVKEGERLDVNVSYNKMIMEMVLNRHPSLSSSSSSRSKSVQHL
ncbi:3-methyl-2-oxobutanoate hydroxymethyltransferase [Cavenderia fasciculata]|uniref:3-methyl-2-oxobutanoate hydroxymethyltransferase n=1 Tax=Cavenderia fasciculata TaxID=261658 RepID=F4PL25_CACFS|nr:3-methyl-2-oxobutanoate hydroxymethyltransferase [Cavenderia fasciculata]EGG23247.1 3-methyl-2-oxobutanoate hydroxymethyltransferase [Cavenderia fasciculata]|eukprot:XP_004361098.1 3-methyl-2-oxobutanoate hydroxymethyltransferase [Cavenderia fasciculata]